jgi:phosphoribosylaminoimidazole-succinocarboxamide synthase
LHEGHVGLFLSTVNQRILVKINLGAAKPSEYSSFRCRCSGGHSDLGGLGAMAMTWKSGTIQLRSASSERRTIDRQQGMRMADALYETSIKSLPLLHQGKVRDIYAIDDQRMLIVTTDRLSAFDVVMPTPIPGKGRVLTAVADFWFAKLADILPNQLTGIDPETVVAPAEREQVRGRALVVKRLKALPVEAIVRGYLVGSGWADYQRTGSVCGIALPVGLRQAEKLPEPLFTPSTKAAVGEHDENIDYAACERLLGADLAARARAAAIALYRAAADYALTRGLIIADTKFEFGLDANGALTLIDEVLTPDSSRYWPVAEYQVGANPPSFDKQYVRDWLLASGWNKQPPGPELPPDVVARTAEKYAEALRRLVP